MRTLAPASDTAAAAQIIQTKIGGITICLGAPPPAASMIYHGETFLVAVFNKTLSLLQK